MARVISVHEYTLKTSATKEAFEQAIQEARASDLLRLPGLVEYHFVKGLRGPRKNCYAAIWIYESTEAWERLWGPVDRPRKKAEYPVTWKRWEEEVLRPFLAEDPDEIRFTAYEEL